jgi:histone deacetylase 11
VLCCAEQVELEQGTCDSVYLCALEAALQRAVAEFPEPHLLIYNAGTDILAGDPLGRFSISPAAVIQRDAAVFALAAEQLKCPVVMLLSGGYTKASAGVIVDSVVNLMKPSRTSGNTALSE